VPTASTGSSPSASAACLVASSPRMTCSLAPPCSGPLSVPSAATTAECMSERVAAQTRAAKVEAFIVWSGMQHQAGVEEAGFALRRPHAGDLEQEVGRQPELGVGFPGRPASPCCLVGGDQNGLLGGQPGCLAEVRPGLVGAGVRVIGAGQRDQAAQRLHRLLLRATSGRVPAASLPRARPAAISPR